MFAKTENKWKSGMVHFLTDNFLFCFNKNSKKLPERMQNLTKCEQILAKHLNKWPKNTVLSGCTAI